MTCNWPLVQASEFVEFNPKISLKKEEIAPKISMEDLTPFTKNIGSYSYAPYRGGSKFINGDILFARITPCLENGKTAYVDCLNEGEVGFGSTEFIVLRAIKQVSDPNFVYYLSISPQFRSLAIKSMVGSSGRQRVQLNALANYSFRLPPLSDQKKIANYLSSLDKKIFLNQQINDNLKEQARAIYYERFEKIDFNRRSFNWQLKTLGDIAVISTKSLNPAKESEALLEHYSIPAFDETGFPVFEKSSSIKSNKYLVDEFCLLISKLNPTIKRIWRPYCLSNKAVCSTEFIVFKAKNKDLTDFLYSVIDSKSFFDFMCSHVTGSTGSRQRTTPAETLGFEFLFPSSEEIQNFQELVAPMYKQMKINAIENAKLKQIRDNLLPKLLAGETNTSL